MFYLAKSLLFFGNALWIIPFITIGLICFDRRIFYQAACLTLLSMLFNVALKISFQIPLPPELGKPGFGFPSGHMQMATILYIWFAIQMKMRGLTTLIIVMLCGFAWSLTYFSYHDLFQVFGGAFFGLLILIGYNLIYLNWPQKLPSIILILATILISYIQYQYPLLSGHAWQGYYGLSGLIIANSLIAKTRTRLLSPKLVASLSLFLVMIIILIFFKTVMNDQEPFYLSQLFWFFLCFLILCTENLATKLIGVSK
ncbi:MAG: phosphatase PAP2 family protein [Tatlockia sp.]|nr:phosphatase PAP2 family protein [Tatlockia sp.]